MRIKFKILLNKVFISILLLTVSFLLTACANQPEASAYDPPGFFMGIVHGFTILFGFIGSIFFDMRIYAFPNSGVFYDLGYMIGIGVHFLLLQKLWEPVKYV